MGGTILEYCVNAPEPKLTGRFPTYASRFKILTKQKHACLLFSQKLFKLTGLMQFNNCWQAMFPLQSSLYSSRKV